MTNHKQEILEKIKSAHENIALTVGTLLAMILIAYFLSYSALANSNYTWLFWFEILSSPVIVMALFYIRKIAFLLLNIRFMASKEHKKLLEDIELSDLSQ